MEIVVPREHWDSLTEDQRQEVTTTLQASGALQRGDRIVAGDVELQFAPEAQIMADGPCQAACTAAYGRATRLCTLLPHPAAKAACYAGAMAVYAVCLRNC